MRTLLLVIGVALIAGTAAYAHHSYAATYDVTKEVKLEGKLVQFVLRNPHSFVHMEAPDEHGAMQALGRRVGRHRAARRAGREARVAEGRRRDHRHRASIARAR